MKTAFALGSLLVMAGCAAAPGPAAKVGGLDRLERWMTGSFSSAAQARADRENFRDIRLFMTPVWRGRSDGRWMYVEQAAAESLDRPYRQRIYRLTQLPDGRFESAVFLLPGDVIAFAGAWRTPSLLDGLDPDDLSAREGCSIILTDDGDAFRGGTVGRGCASDLRGAAYATSEAVILADRLETWDRGYNEQGVQVWGATRGGYVFERVEAAAR